MSQSGASIYARAALWYANEIVFWCYERNMRRSVRFNLTLRQSILRNENRRCAESCRLSPSIRL